MTAAERCKAEGWTVGTRLRCGTMTATIDRVYDRAVVMLNFNGDPFVWSFLDGWSLIPARTRGGELRGSRTHAGWGVVFDVRCRSELRQRRRRNVVCAHRRGTH